MTFSKLNLEAHQKKLNNLFRCEDRKDKHKRQRGINKSVKLRQINNIW